MIPGSTRTGGQFSQFATSTSTTKEPKKMTTQRIGNSMCCSRLRCGFFLVPIALCWFGLSSAAQAVNPPPDGGYGGNNTAEGTDALFSLTTGVWNVAVGFQALHSDTIGNQNTAVGYRALFSNVSGDKSTAYGSQALFSNTVGNDNVASGFSTLFSNIDGNRNTGMGYRTLLFNVSGNDNTAIGWNALYNNRGTASNNTAVGSTALLHNNTGIDNTAVGFQAMQNNVSAFTNVAVGTFAAQNSDSSFNTAVGGFALRANTDGTRNTAVGAGALETASGGSDNTAVGELAGLGISTHSNIIAIGSGVSGVDSVLGEVDNACYIGNIHGRPVSGGTFAFVLVDASGKLGTMTVDANGNNVMPSLPGANLPQAVPQLIRPQAIGPDPKEAMLNRKVEELQATVARQQKQIDALSSGLQKVSAQLEASKPAPKVVANK
jgi:hypothetical protein